ncbi:MFS transporter [Gulosibacter chungangensis]|uniref:MHS family MFS transporter n=1 Tax=Gulosibacter chungangensis TaxID=979746 RepID=A0A7J5B8J5_9MICO|nr:MFS transporter [Gulosibacter chungangensis]KAB1640995.1 MHS family MFS transporter [Gulosibacter chungangensis]
MVNVSTEYEKVAEPTRTQIMRATVAGTLGTTLEYYDYVIYGLATALIFNQLFYSDLPPAIGFIAGFATYAVGFIIRPVGGLILGAIGDRIGRKVIMVLTIVLMGAATFAIGLLPTYEQVGVIAPLLLIVCRMAQGFATGAELASASSLMVETAPRKHRGFVGSFVSFGTNSGNLLATVVWLLISMLPEEQLMSWGWRLPFLGSIVLTFLGLWIRKGVKESHIFESVAERQRKVSMGEVYRNFFKSGWRSFLVCFGLRIGEGGTSAIYQVFLVGYIATLPNQSQSMGATALLISSLFGIVAIPLIGILTDKVGRRRVFIVLAAIQLLFAFPGVMMIESGSTVAIIVAFLIASGVCVQGMYATESAYMVEMFGLKHRLTGVTASKELGGLTGAGIAPLVVAALLAAVGHWWVIAAYIAVLAAIGLVSAIISPEVKARDLTVDEDAM